MKNGDQNQISAYAAKVITQNTENLQSCLEKVKRRKESEDIHDLRVASRRLRTDLEIFRHFLPVKKYKIWEPSIASLTKAFGNARDLDVQLEFIRNFFQLNDETKNRPGGRRLKLRLEQRRGKLEGQLKDKLAEIEKNGTLVDILNEFKNLSNEVNEKVLPPSPIFALSFNVLNKRLDEFLSYEIYLPFPEQVKELHLMRIAAKRLRYALELFAPLYPDQLEGTLEVMRSVQTSLGEIRDCDVWLIFLPEFLEKEKKRVIAYYGNARPFQRLFPGIQLVYDNRKKERESLYTKFLKDWKGWRQGEVWSDLRQTIFNPIMGNPSAPDLNSQNTK